MSELGYHDPLPFGKHRGKTVRDVIDQDPTYLEWALLNVEGFELTDDAGKRLDLELSWQEVF